MSSARRLVVVGGGIGGLAAAWSAHEALAARPGAFEVQLLEREPKVGGKACSIARQGYLVEAGPTGYLDDEPVLRSLVERARLEPLRANEAAAHRFVVHAGALREIQAHPLRFARSGILSAGGLARLAAEPFVPRRAHENGHDESVFDFARRRLGEEAAQRLIAPMVLGVFAGDARRLSLASAFPRMAELEREHRSLFRAMAKLKREKRLSGGPAGPGAALTSFAQGLQALPLALAERAPFRVRTDAKVLAIEHDAGARRWALTIADDAERLAADALVLACDLRPATELLRGIAPPIASELERIPIPGVAVVALGYGANELARVPRGFGALIPRGEGYRILGVLWDTHLFPGRSPAGTLLARAMLGGATDLEAAALPERELARIAQHDLARLHGLQEPPRFTSVTRWPAAIPQYVLGHAARVASVERELDTMTRSHPPLHLAGNYLHGVAFGKSAAHGWRVGERAAAALADRAPD